VRTFAAAAALVLLGVAGGWTHASIAGLKLGFAASKDASSAATSSEATNGAAASQPSVSIYAAKGKPFITTAYAAELLKSGEADFLAAGTQAEYEAGRVPGAQLLTPDAFDGGAYPALLQAMSRDRTVVVYCESGCGAAEYVAQRIVEFGFEKTLILADGFVGWKSAGHAIEGRR
jgi:rhodanese-related sulfurtransferase